MADDLKSLIAVRVRSARKAAGLTQEELAARIAVTPETISNIERARQVPSVETLCAMGRELHWMAGGMLDELNSHPSKSAWRAGLEAKLGAAVSLLSDQDLEVAVAQLEALARRPARS